MASDSDYFAYTVNTGNNTITDKASGAAGTWAIHTSDNTTLNTTLGDANGNESFSAGASPVTTGGYKYEGLATVGGISGFYASKSGVTYFLTKNSTPITAGTPISLTPDTHGLGGADYTFCFMPGTLIATPQGERAVETLAIGDLVTTVEGTARPIRWIGRQAVSTLFADPLTKLPVRIKAGALAEGVPSRDLLVSPGHALLIDGVLVQAGALVNGTTIHRDDSVPANFTYYHIETADHAIILAENTPAETFVDNATRATFDNAAEYDALFADSPAMAELDLPRAMSSRQVPMAIRQRIAARAAALSNAESSQHAA
jgi:hypothetical protein